MCVCFSFSDIGEGWAPAILNIPEELDFLKHAQKSFINDRSYWLGGSTSKEPWSTVNLSDYIPGDSGFDIVFSLVYLVYKKRFFSLLVNKSVRYIFSY